MAIGAADPDAYRVAVLREFSAGGVVVRRMRGGWYAALIRPAGKDVWALPKGNVDPGEKPAETALREVREETGLEGRLVTKLGDVRYVYSRRGARIFKVVSFFLVASTRGRLGEIEPAMRREVAETRWVPLGDAPRALAYGGERDMAARALEELSRDAL